MFWDKFFLGPIGQEAKAKTVIISGLAVTAGQFLVTITINIILFLFFLITFCGPVSEQY